MKVGDKVTVERRFGFQSLSEAPRSTYEATIVRVTAKRAYLDKTSWFALDDPDRSVKPRYLDYNQHAKLGATP